MGKKTRKDCIECSENISFEMSIWFSDMWIVTAFPAIFVPTFQAACEFLVKIIFIF